MIQLQRENRPDQREARNIRIFTHESSDDSDDEK
jgi:hypothetical protein